MRGRFNAEYVFVGEAPGETEDTLGLPFVGISGKLLDSIIQKVGLDDHNVCFVNSIACTPYQDSRRAAIRPPNKDEIKKCSPRLQEFLSLSPRKKVVAVGNVASKALSNLEVDHISIVHPAFIVRQSATQAEVWIKRTLLLLKKEIGND